ncbi:HAMP domain-containing protein [Candidatus Woesearchaeota archaeon]|nr:HAMP domain-containing protein [Candidatus Woesearchaeota archaeon]
MAKIRTTILVSFSIVIAMMLSLSLVLSVVHSNIENQYKQITDTMILEYDITETFSEFITSYTLLLRDIENTEYGSSYEDSKSRLSVIYSKLDSAIFFEESWLVYTNLKSMSESIMEECDIGLEKTRNNDFSGGTGIYDRALRGEEYVKDKTAELLLSELKYSKELQAKLDFIRSMSLAISLVLILLITVGCVVFAVSLSNKISGPLIRLSGIAEKIAKGNLKISVDQDLLKKDDETGSLSNSFNEMVKRLAREISSQKEINSSLTKVRRQVELKNKVLEDREKKLVTINSKLEVANQKLKELDKAKDEFISIAAHELKTPLTSIKGFAQLLNTQNVMKDKKKQSHYLGLVNENTDRLYNLILDLVDSSRLSLGKLSIDIKEVNTEDIFRNIKENMSQVIKESGIKPVFSIEKDVPKVKADPERLLQVIRNLIVNATHFTKIGGTITFDVRKKGDFVQFSIKDTGEGIPKEKQHQIFSRFYQADASLTRKVKGSGLGLSICKGLVELMKGKIWFESVEGKGTTFFFTVPVAGKK